MRESSNESKRFEVLGEVGFWVKATSHSEAMRKGEGVINKFLDGRLFKDDEVYNPWIEVKRVDEIK